MAFLLLLADNPSFNDLKERMKFIVAGNHKYMETVVSEGSSFVNCGELVLQNQLRHCGKF